MAVPKSDVALFGTFDVANYGDLLFPHVAAHLLGETLGTLRCYSPRGGAPDWEDVVPARPMVEFHRDPAPALCLIGGGNIVHANPTPLPDYANAFPDSRFTYASLWLGASMLAASKGAKLAWNAPGVPRPIEGAWARHLRDLVLAGADYLSLRDEASRVFLGACGNPAVLPDTALKLASIWPAAALAGHAEEAFASRGMALPERWLALHFNRRYVGANLAAACASAGRIAAALNATPVLLAIGPCHGDDELVRQAALLMKGPVLVVDRPRGLKEIAALIAHAQAYVGSSMHGLVTALSYRRPGLAIARPQMVKFLGLLEQIGEPYFLQENWKECEALIEDLQRPLRPTTLSRLDTAERLIDAHGERLRSLLGALPFESAVEGRAALHEAVLASAPAHPEWRSFRQALLGEAHSCEDPASEAQAIAVSLRGGSRPKIGHRIAKARERWPKHLRLAMLEAEWLERSGDVTTAKDRLTALHGKHPNNPWPAVRLVRLLASEGEAEAARALYDECLRALPLSAAIHAELHERITSAEAARS